MSDPLEAVRSMAERDERDNLEEGRRPGVYARLAEEAEVERTLLAPPRGTRLVGVIVCLAIAGAVIAAAVGAHPW